MDYPSVVDCRALARRLAADVDRAAPLLARILLVRAISRLDIWVANDMVRDCGRAGKLAVPDASTLRLAQVLAPPYVFGGDLTTAIAAVERLASAMWREQRSFRTYLGATDPELGRDNERVERAGRAWEDARHRVSGGIRSLPGRLGDGMVGSVLLDRALDRTFRRGFLTAYAGVTRLELEAGA
jgi:hypothetical protein